MCDARRNKIAVNGIATLIEVRKVQRRASDVKYRFQKRTTKATRGPTTKNTTGHALAAASCLVRGQK